MSELPNGWAVIALEELGSWGSGGTPKRTDSRFYSNGTIPWLVIGDLNDGIVTKAQTCITEEGLFNSSAKLLPPNTLLIAMYGSIGKLGITGIDCATNQAIAFCIPDQEIIALRYLFHALKYSRDKLTAQGQGVAQKNISQTILKAHHIPVAPRREQSLIADKLDSFLARVDACRDRLDRVSNIIKRFRQAVLEAATLGKLTEDWRAENFDGESGVDLVKEEIFSLATSEDDLPLLPDSWEWVALGNYAQCSRGRFSARPRNDPTHFNGEYPFIQIGDLPGEGGWITTHKQTLNAKGLAVSKKFSKGTVVVAIVGSTIGNTGVLAYDMCFTDSMIGIETGDEVSNQYIELFLRCRKEDIRQASYAGGGQPNINLEVLNPYPVALPPLSEQYEIVRRVEALFIYADRLETHCQNSYTQVERLVPMLLSKAFRGELVPQDSNDEPASVLLERIRAEKAPLEAERKTTRIVRHLSKQAPKNMIKQLSEYSEALRSAFIATGRGASARQLFDQAEFSSEEVVQFYEALRITPEVRTAFEKPVGENLQQQRLLLDSTDKSTTPNGRFRLVELWLEDFKNLSDYTVHFNPTHGIDIVLGWNGTGKSNLLEALVIIFRDLHRWWEKNQWTEKPMKDYRLRYEIDGRTVEVIWQPAEMKRPKLRMGTIEDGAEEPEIFKNITREELSLPRFIFGYYSGPTNRLAEHFLPMKRDHYNRLLEATSDNSETLTQLLEQRRFFCAENHHAKYVLLAFCHREDPAIIQFLEDKLRIVGFESALFIIRKPRWAKKGRTAEDFWGAEGVMRRVMERLRRFAIAPIVVEQTVNDGYRSKREDHYYFFLPDLQSLHAFAAEYQNARSFFIALESTDFSELIYDLKIQVRVKATHTKQVAITFHELSEGEQQLLMVLGLMRFTKSHQSLILLDEPDTHLNPHWSVDYLKLLTRVMSENSDESEEQQTSQILMSTHDPLVIASLVKEQIQLLKRDFKTGICKWGQPTVDPRGLGFTGILTSEMFGMRSDLDEETLADLDTKVRLVAKEGSLTSEEVVELEEINKRLEDAGFQKAFSDPYYAAFIRAWGRRHSDLMAGARFLSPAQQEEIDRISREVLEEAITELQAEAVR